MQPCGSVGARPDLPARQRPACSATMRSSAARSDAVCCSVGVAGRAPRESGFTARAGRGFARSCSRPSATFASWTPRSTKSPAPCAAFQRSSTVLPFTGTRATAAASAPSRARPRRSFNMRSGLARPDGRGELSTRASASLDEPRVLRRLPELLLEPLEALAERRLADGRRALVGQHHRDLAPGEAPVHPEDEERRLLGLERLAELRHPLVAPGLLAGRRRADLLGEPRSLGRLEPAPPLPVRIADEARAGVPRHPVSPAPQRSVPPEGREPLPQVLGELREDLVRVGLAAQDRREIREHLWPELPDRRRGSLAPPPSGEQRLDARVERHRSHVSRAVRPQKTCRGGALHGEPRRPSASASSPAVRAGASAPQATRRSGSTRPHATGTKRSGTARAVSRSMRLSPTSTAPEGDVPWRARMRRVPSGSGLRAASSPPTTSTKRSRTPRPARIRRARVPGLFVCTASANGAASRRAERPGKR